MVTPAVLTRSHRSAGARNAPVRRVRLRALRRSDGAEWRRLRISDEDHLRPVEPTLPVDWHRAHDKAAWRSSYARLAKLARTGIIVPGVIEVDGKFAGQLTLGNIQHGAISSAWIGYWVHSSLHGQGVATAAVALGVDHAMREVRLHRVEATVMETNPASQAVLRRTGFRQEGYLRRNLHIDGQWTDHLLFAQTREDIVGGGRVRQLLNDGVLGIAPR